MHVFVTRSKDDEEHDIDECILSNAPRHAESMVNILADFVAVGELVFVMSNMLWKGILNKVDLFYRPLITVVILQYLPTLICWFHIVK